MMIELEERYKNLISKLEEDNYRCYGIKKIGDKYYVSLDDLFNALDDTQDSRKYAEEQIKELEQELSERPIDCNSLQINTLEELKRVKQENIELQSKMEWIQSTLNEDDYDKLAMEGIEL